MLDYNEDFSKLKPALAAQTFTAQSFLCTQSFILVQVSHLCDSAVPAESNEYLHGGFVQQVRKGSPTQNRLTVWPEFKWASQH